MIDPEDFAAWREHPVTQAVFAELARMAEDRREMWMAQSWNSGKVDERALAMLRGQAEGFAWLPRADYKAVFGEEQT